MELISGKRQVGGTIESLPRSLFNPSIAHHSFPQVRPGFHRAFRVFAFGRRVGHGRAVALNG